MVGIIGDVEKTMNTTSKALIETVKKGIQNLMAIMTMIIINELKLYGKLKAEPEAVVHAVEMARNVY